MTAYYNEYNPQAADWLRELIRRDLIAPGEVDERSIVDVSADDLNGFTQHHFFAGIGGWSLALRKAGWSDDVPVVSGSPACQPFSLAGKQLGRNDERHLAPHFAALIDDIRPPFVFGEQVATKEIFGPPTAPSERDLEGEPVWAWIDDLSARLEGSSYAVAATDFPASGIDYPHPRQRTFFGAAELAHGDDQGLQGRPRDGERPFELSARARGVVGRLSLQRHDSIPCRDGEWIRCRDDHWRKVEPGVCWMAHGISDDLVRSGHIVPAHYPLTMPVKGDQRNMRIHGYGNAIVPDVAALFILSFMESVKKSEKGIDFLNF